MRLKFLNQFAEIKREQVEKIGKVQGVMEVEKELISQKYLVKKIWLRCQIEILKCIKV